MTMRSDEPLQGLARGFRKRTWLTARLASKVGLKAARRSLSRTKKNDAPVDTAKAVAAAGELVRQIGGLKGLVMKVAQMASYLPGALPAEAQKVLAELQAHSTAMDYAQIEAVILAELGQTPAQAFDEFSAEPIAAASIGQVHRARLGDRDLAVKVQYPDIEELLRSDLRTMGLFARMSTLGHPTDGGALVRELSERTLEECDYLREAENQTGFARLFADDADCHVPAVVAERSTRRVLATELVEAADFQTFIAEASQAEIDHAAQVIFRTCFDCIFRHAIYNADPHPGNYLFHAGGRVTFLDFGCVRRFDADFIDTWKRVALSLVDDDRASFRRRFTELGMVGKPKRFDWDFQWEAMKHLYRPYTQRQPFLTFTDDYVRETYSMMVFDNPNQRRLVVPKEWLFLNRLQWGLNAVLAQMHATGPWPDMFRAAVESATEPAQL